MSVGAGRRWERYTDRLARAVVEDAERRAAAWRELHGGSRELVRWRTRVSRWWVVSAPKSLWAWLDHYASRWDAVRFWARVAWARFQGHNPARFELREWTVRVEDS